MRRFLMVLMPVTIAVAAILVSRGSVAGHQPATAEELDELIGTAWYSVSIFGRPNGYACIEIERVDGPDGPGLRVTEDLKVMISIAGQDLETSKSQVTIYDASLRPLKIELFKNEMGRQARVEARLEDGEMIVRTSSPEPGAPPPSVQRHEAPSDLTSDLIVALKQIREGISVGDSFSYHVYDADLGAIDRHTVTVDSREQFQGRDALLLRAVSENLGMEVVSLISEEGEMLRQSAPGLMDLMLERVTEDEALAGLVPFEIESEIPIADRLPLVRRLREVRLRVERRVGPAAELIPQSRRQTVSVDGDDAIVTVRRETPPEETSQLPVTDPEFTRYLEATKYLQSDHPRVIETAQEIIGDETDAWAAAQKLAAWVRHNMTAVPSEPRPMTSLEALDALRGDCTEHAILLAALGRAVGLPTRLCTGLAYVGGKFGYHAWNEVYVGRWVEMDSSWGQMTVDAGHILIYSSAVDETSYARASLATGRTIGTVQLQLLGYETADLREIEIGEN